MPKRVLIQFDADKKENMSKGGIYLTGEQSKSPYAQGTVMACGADTSIPEGSRVLVLRTIGDEIDETSRIIFEKDLLALIEKDPQ